MSKTIFLFFLSLQLCAQIPTNTWRTHADYFSAKGVEVVHNKIYSFSDNGFFYFDKADNQVVRLSKADDLSEANIAQIRYNAPLKILLIAYQTGNLDLINISSEGLFDTRQNIDFIKKTDAIQGSKYINQIEYRNDFAYLAADFGLVVLDIKKAEIKETYQNIGKDGKEVSIKQIVFARDSIFLNTSDGILGAKFAANINLQFFGNWHPISDKLLFKPQDFPKDVLIVSPREMDIDNEGKIWIADGENGLLGNVSGNFKSYSPNGVKGNIYEMFYSNQKIYAVGTHGNIFEDNEWQVLNISQVPQHSKDVIDTYGYRWQMSGGGVRVYDEINNQSRLFTTGKNTGNLPSSIVNTIALDKDGIMWIGTNDGIAGITISKDIFSRITDAYTPFNSNGRRILLQEVITKIVIDGGNRKWIATRNGLNLFPPSVDEVLLNFTESNSPLPSSNIVDLTLNSASGELFVLSDKGLLSYQTDATEPSESLSSIRIFPNPIRPDYQGIITISGLTENTSVKITDAAGRLVYQIKSNGGTASWDIQNTQGSRTDSGIYMVFCIAQDGAESFVGKLAMIK